MEDTWNREVTYMDETVTYNFETGVLALDDNALSNVTLYPNPTTDGTVSLSFKDIIPKATVTLFNVLGQKITNQKNMGIHIKGDPGLYFITV